MSLRQLGRIPVQSWPQTSIEHATLPIDSAPSMEPSAPALGALHLILEEGAELIAIMADGRLLGLVTRDQLARATVTPSAKQVELRPPTPPDAEGSVPESRRADVVPCPVASSDAARW